MAGAPRIYTLVSGVGNKREEENLHRLDGVVGLLYGLNLHILDGVWEQELVDDINLVLVERSDGSESIHGWIRDETNRPSIGV
jgi:hypothetical protein